MSCLLFYLHTECPGICESSWFQNAAGTYLTTADLARADRGSQPCGRSAREVKSLFGSPPRPSRSSGKSAGGCLDECLDGRLELVLGRAQLLSARWAGKCSRGLEGGVREVHQLRVPADKLYPEPGDFCCGTQAVALDVGLSGFLPARVPLRAEPQGNEPCLQLGDGRCKASNGIRLLLPTTLVALECLRPLSRATLEQISRKRPQKHPGNADKTREHRFHPRSPAHGESPCLRSPHNNLIHVPGKRPHGAGTCRTTRRFAIVGRVHDR